MLGALQQACHVLHRPRHIRPLPLLTCVLAIHGAMKIDEVGDDASNADKASAYGGCSSNGLPLLLSLISR